MHRLSDRVRKYTRKDKRNEINTSNMAAEAYARRTAKFNDFKRDGIFRNHNRNVLDTFAPYETVVPMAMPEILILTPCVRLGRIVPAMILHRTRGDDRRAFV